MVYPILILHGWGSSAKKWSQVKNLLEFQGYRVFVPDLPGFGENPAPSEAWSLDDYVDWLEKYCEQQNLSQFFLLGHSFGGRIAIKFANKYPEKIKGLILCSAAGITPPAKIKIFIFNFLSKMGKLIFSLPFLRIFQGVARKFIYFLSGNKDYYFLQDKIMKETFKKVIREDLTNYLPQIKIPTLIVWGEKDKITPLSDAYKMHQEIKNSVLEIIPQGKHAFYFQFPEKLTEIILNFLKNYG